MPDVVKDGLITREDDGPTKKTPAKPPAKDKAEDKKEEGK